MKNINNEMLTEMTPQQVVDLFPNLDIDEFKESGVYKFDLGSRGEIDEFEGLVSNPDFQNFFPVKTEEEILEEIIAGIDEEDLEEELPFASEFVSSDFETIENFNVYMEGYFEESATYYVKVSV